jgi:hypothetical protein
MTLVEDIRAGNAEPEITHALARLVVDENCRPLGMCLIPMKPSLEPLALPASAHAIARVGPRIIFEPLPLIVGEFPDQIRGFIWILAQGEQSDLLNMRPDIYQPLAVYFGPPGEEG